MVKIITYYLPQYHTFEENDRWWGKGFTEWTNVKRALPIYPGHQQPRIPLSNNYYNLLDIDTLKWQVKLAKKYGIYGFCYYHYWFDGKMLMNKPMELLLSDSTIDMPFCISWANEDWTRTWSQKSREVLISQSYNDKNTWKNHFLYLLPFFRDKRYIKEDGKPIFIIYRPELIKPLREMIEFWQALANENGLRGIKFVYQYVNYNHLKDKNGDLFDYGIEYQPTFVRKSQRRTIKLVIRKIKHEIATILRLKQKLSSTIYFDYDETWKKILNIVPRDVKMLPGAFVNWDNTPRHGMHGSVMVGYTVSKFENYLSEQINRAKTVYKGEYLFLFAWNEWGEGGYLEPDETEKYARLEAIKRALINNNEFPF